MKLRQKLAVVLASAMIITAVPVTTMAASTNGFNKTVSLVEGTQVTSSQALTLDMKFDQNAEGQTFYLDATDFEFNVNEYKLVANKNLQDLKEAVNVAQAVVDAADKAATAEQKDALKAAKDAFDKANKDAKVEIDGLKISVLSDKQIRVEVIKDTDNTTVVKEISVPVYGKAKKGTPAITVDGSDSLATSGKYSLSGSEIVTDKVLAVTAGDAKSISIEGTGSIADITIEEHVVGSLAGKTVTMTLPNSSDLIFNSKYAGDGAVVEFEGKRGLADIKNPTDATVLSANVVAKYVDKDNKKIEITFSKDFKNTSRGSVVLKGITVQAEDKKADCSTGEVKVTVKGSGLADTNLVVANVSDFGVAYTVAEVKELTAGQGDTVVKVKIKENAIDTLNKKRDIYFTMDNAEFVSIESGKGLSFDEKKEELTLNLESAEFKEGKINEFEFEVKIAAKATHNGAVTLTASSRNFEEDMKLEVAKVNAAVEIKAEPITVKAGLKDQVGGKIVITETKEEKLAKNKKIIITADDAWGFAIEDAKIEVTGGDIQIEKDVNKDGELIITVKRSSSEASEITISDVKVTTNRTVPEGAFDFVLGGNAISQRNENKDVTTTEKEDERFADALTVKDFVKVGTKNTEDLPNAAAAKEIVLTVGSKEYTVNKEAKTADAAAYIDANNRTMVPVKFIAEEFGKLDFGTVNGVGTVTVFKDGSVLQFQNGSNIMNKNGIAIPMDTAVVIKDGRTYVPFKYVADGLGIGFSFDPATKSITFTNQVK